MAGTGGSRPTDAGAGSGATDAGNPAAGCPPAVGTLRVRVVDDATGSGISGVLVESRSHTATTDAQGRCQFTNFPVGSHPVAASKTAYINNTAPATVPGSVTIRLRLVTVEIEVNNTATTSDDFVQVKSTSPASRHRVPCRARIVGTTSGNVNVVLTNPDGRLRFPAVGDTTRNLTLAANGAWSAFEISGETASTAVGDAVIQARLNSATGQVLGSKGVTVFTGVEIEVNNTPTADDDFMRIARSSDRPTLPCRAKVVGVVPGNINVVLTNPDGRLRFPAVGDTTKNLTLAANGAWSTFEISGQTASSAVRDAVIQARLNSATGQVLSSKGVTVFTGIEFIRQDNSAFPTTGNNACHMVSKFVTNVNLPDTATFDGPPGSPPDPDTFRVQVRDLPAGQSLRVRVEVLRSGSTTYTHLFNTIHGTVGGDSLYRIDEHLRLVSNGPPSPKPAGATYDDEYRAHQTILVKLEDVVRATLVMGGQNVCSTELPVGRPPSENGSKAIRTVDIHFVTLRGVSSTPSTIVSRMSEDWAQVAIRYNLKSSVTVTPVTNVLSTRGTAGSNGQLSVDITPQGGTQTSVSTAISNGNSAEQMASRLATAISANAGLTATHHRHQNEWLVLVNKGQEVSFANINSTVSGVVFSEPLLNFNNDINLLEGSVLGLNFKDTAPKSITMIAVTDINVLGGDAAAGGNYLQTSLPGWHNVAILREACIDRNDGTYPTGAGHEMGHVLFNVGNSGHSGVSTNLFYAYENRNAPETFASRKRLIDSQNTDARTRSGPSTTPGLLQKK